MTLSIRWRLTLWYGAVLAVVMAAFGTAVYLTMRQHALGRIDQGLSEELAEVLTEMGQPHTEAELLEWLERRFSGHEGFDYQITRPGGKRFFVNRRLADTGLPVPETGGLSESPSYREVAVEGGKKWRVASVQVRGPGGPLTVQVARSLAGFDHESEELLLTMLLTGPLTLLVAVGGGYFLARRALAPVDQLRRRTREITADRLDRRLPVVNPGDELGQLAQTVNDMIGRLERSFAEVRRFTADASHELRTPLTVIRTEVEVALRKDGVPAEQQQLMGSILEECGRLTQLTDQLLTLSREDAGVGSPARARLDLAALLKGLVEILQPLAQAKGVALCADLPGPLWVLGDEVRVRQVFLNLLDNALKYTPERGNVEVRAERRDGSVVVAIRDTGEGIPPEHLPRVFDRFYRVDRARNRERGGTGLGLSIARSIVVAHGGQIELESAPGRGTTCIVSLPEHLDGGNSRT
jgi:heavy metal sensor kinase